MLNLGKLASNVLNSIDNAAKETLEEGAPKQPSATQIRSQRRAQQEGADGAPLSSSSSAAEASPPPPASAPAAASTHAAPPAARAPSAIASSAAPAAESSHEIDRLNAECLELEDQVVSLKKEVQEAWDSYKVAQGT